MIASRTPERSTRRNKPATSLWLLLVILTMVGDSFAQQQNTPLVNREQALAAYAKFKTDPIGNLKSAPDFIRFIQTDGEVHIVLNRGVIPWMYEEHDPEIKAVLYAAYMGGNMSSQLTGSATGDDPVRGIEGVIDAYVALQQKNADLKIPLIERLAMRRAEGSLAAAVNELSSSAP